MSTGYGRLCEARDKAQPIAPDETVEVLAIDLDETLNHYRTICLALSDAKAACKYAIAWCDAAEEEIVRLRGLIAAHVNASNNDGSAGDTFAALVGEVNASN